MRIITGMWDWSQKTQAEWQNPATAETAFWPLQTWERATLRSTGSAWSQTEESTSIPKFLESLLASRVRSSQHSRHGNNSISATLTSQHLQHHIISAYSNLSVFWLQILVCGSVWADQTLTVVLPRCHVTPSVIWPVSQFTSGTGIKRKSAVDKPSTGPASRLKSDLVVRCWGFTFLLRQFVSPSLLVHWSQQICFIQSVKKKNQIHLHLLRLNKNKTILRCFQLAIVNLVKKKNWIWDVIDLICWNVKHHNGSQPPWVY